MGIKVELVAVISCDEPSCSCCDEFKELWTPDDAHQFFLIARGNLFNSGWPHETGFGYRCPTHTHYPNMTHHEIDAACDTEAM